MDDEAMRWTMRRCGGRCGDAMDDAVISASSLRIGAPDTSFIFFMLYPASGFAFVVV